MDCVINNTNVYCIRQGFNRVPFSAPPPTVLRFVSPTDNIYSCSFVQMLAQRLENAFDEAQDKVLETYNRLIVEVRSRLVEAFQQNQESHNCPTSTTRLLNNCLVLIQWNKLAAPECTHCTQTILRCWCFKPSLPLFLATFYFSFPILLLWLSTS